MGSAVSVGDWKACDACNGSGWVNKLNWPTQQHAASRTPDVIDAEAPRRLADDEREPRPPTAN
jgi:hypothetical protein